MAAQPQRTPFTLADAARIVGGRIVQVHDNHCRALASGRTEDCRCEQVEYKLVRVGGQR